MDFSKHGKGTTSVKVNHAPGGQSNFSLAWDAPDNSTKNKGKNNQPQQQPPQQQLPQQQQQFKQQNHQQSNKQEQEVTQKVGQGYHHSKEQQITGKIGQKPEIKQVEQQQNQGTGKTSVKVHNPPGGKSSFTLG